MEPINGWHEVEEAGSFEKIELGGHICVILDARCEDTRSGNKMLVVAYDFAKEDKQAGYYTAQFEVNKKKDPNVKYRGTYYQGYGTEQSTPYFKAFINRILESNPGYQWDWDEKGLKGKRFCGVFGREEYLNDKGESKFSIKCMQVKDVSDLENVEIPTDKLLDKKPNTHIVQNGFTTQHTYTSTLDISSDDLPF